jgi:hypothetical protein
VNVWRTFVLSVVTLWLAVQGFAAVAMPFCPHALGNSSAVQTNGTHSDRHQHSHHHGKTSGDSDRSNGLPIGLSCNDCGACHLACSPVVPYVVIAVISSCGHIYNSLLPASESLFIPEQLKPPPLTAIA